MSIVPKVAAFLKENAPESVFRAAKFAYNKVIRANKTTDELNFWLMQHIRNGGKFDNAFYERVMLEMARDIGREGLAGKTVCDFGCGPRGTLAWLAGALGLLLDGLRHHVLCGGSPRRLDEGLPLVLPRGRADVGAVRPVPPGPGLTGRATVPSPLSGA